MVDHANSDQHRAAMNHMERASGTPNTEYSPWPIAQGPLNINKVTQDRIIKKFVISYVIARQGMLGLCNISRSRSKEMVWTLFNHARPKVFSHYIYSRGTLTQPIASELYQDIQLGDARLGSDKKFGKYEGKLLSNSHTKERLIVKD